MNVGPDPLSDLGRGADELGIPLDANKRTQFSTLLDLLMETATRVNLTSLRDKDAIVRRHFVESLALGHELQRRGLLSNATEVLDLGSGAGFPGLPLKIAWPQITIQLLEATGKKARFLEHAIATLDLDGAAVLQGRAEVLAHDPQFRAAFSLVVARSVAPLPVLIELALPFLSQAGMLAALKGSRSFEEVADSGAALKACGGQVVEHVPRVNGAGLGLVLVRKVAATPNEYPRRPGLPTKRPLGS